VWPRPSLGQGNRVSRGCRGDSTTRSRDVGVSAGVPTATSVTAGAEGLLFFFSTENLFLHMTRLFL
jgi:hypothetical protein